jgi:mono/diheme cytochrome c family protein
MGTVRVDRALVAAVVVALGCAPDEAPATDAAAAAEPPAELADGRALFETHCAACHGVAGVGTDQGPPLVHRIYEPSHHGDAAFQLAVARGVRAHHWRFGDMQPVPGVTEADVARIVAYVRWLQRQAGIT